MFYVKKSITFYEKPGCAGNKKQKELLMANGIEFEVKSMLSTNWDTTTLNSFFEGLEKNQIINQFAPQVKSGEINIEKYSKDELVELMIKEPILIKRPLIQVDDTKICGFDIPKLNSALNQELDTKKEIGTCQSSDSCTSV
ncbi:ArsC/Spx/MgsR family protein [Halarcobacter sp.]|uniref:ArsC/Spx/MgsR family protein n=1 Tax=Halarcobacter sp. TaxID=2321133 RepID=UPI0029F488AA|nr:ArsC/Spx/MgsR family protein [Halarcobacter sp.]